MLILVESWEALPNLLLNFREVTYVRQLSDNKDIATLAFSETLVNLHEHVWYVLSVTDLNEQVRHWKMTKQFLEHQVVSVRKAALEI